MSSNHFRDSNSTMALPSQQHQPDDTIEATEAGSNQEVGAQPEQACILALRKTTFIQLAIVSTGPDDNSSPDKALATLTRKRSRSNSANNQVSRSLEDEEDASDVKRASRTFDFKSFTWFAEKIRGKISNDFATDKNESAEIINNIPNTDKALSKGMSRFLLLGCRADILKCLKDQGIGDVGTHDASWSELEDKVKRWKCSKCKFYDHRTRDCPISRKRSVVVPL